MISIYIDIELISILLLMPDQKLNLGGRVGGRGAKFKRGPMNPNDAMVVVLKDILLCLLGFKFMYIVHIS